MKTKILLIGGSGFIGTRIIENLKNDFDIFSDKSIYKKKKLNLNLKLHQTNSILKIIKKNKINILIHLASSVYSYSKKEEFEIEKKQIIIPTIKLIKNLKDNVKIIFISSGGTVYGNKKNASENYNVKPVNYLAKSKKKIEKNIIKYSKLKTYNYLILRLSNIYGFKNKINQRQGLVENVFRLILKKKNIILRNNGNDKRDYLYIDDFIEILKKLMKTKLYNEVINISSGNVFDSKEIVSKISIILKQIPRIIFKKKNKLDKINYISLSNKKLMGIIDHKFVNIDSGLKIVAKKYRLIN